MKVLHLVDDMTESGGVAVYVGKVMAAQRSRGLEVSFVNIRDGVLASSGGCDALLAYDVLHFHAPIPAMPRLAPTVRTVHGHQPYCPSASKHWGRSGQPCDVVASVGTCLIKGHFAEHCGSIRPRKMIAEFRLFQNERAAGHFARMLAISPYVQSRLLEVGYPNRHVALLELPRPSVDPARKLVGRSPAFLYVGRLTGLKGVDWLLRSLPAGAALDIVGDGPYRRLLENLAASLGISEHVTFHGWLGQEEVRLKMAGALALVIPSVWHEPGGLVMYEAWSVGTPVIASDAGNLADELRASRGGWLVPVNDVAALRGALMNASRIDPTAVGEAGRDYVLRRPDLDSHVEALTAQYLAEIECANGGHRPG